MSEPRDLIANIPDSGYELVAKRKQKTKRKLATTRDYLKLDWEPWKRPPSLEAGQLLPRRTDWDETGITARMACAVMLKTCAELIESLQKAGDDASNEVLFRLASEKERLLGIVAMIEGAFCRVLAAAHHERPN
jgi:hypothetical protein